MFHVLWMVVCVSLGLALPIFILSAFEPQGWAAVITFFIFAIPGGIVTWYAYLAGRFVAAPISNLFFQNPVAPKKRLVDGITIRACYALAMLSVVVVPLYLLLSADPTFDAYSGVFTVACLGIWAVVTHEIQDHPGLFLWVAKLTRGIREDVRRSKRGDGGDGQLAGFWKEFDYPWIPGTLLLGQSLFGKHWVGYKDIQHNGSDDRHLVTFAGSRAGKGISRIIPNLLLWPDNAIIIDPKGENATVTAQNPIRAQAYVIDPYHMVKNISPREEQSSLGKGQPIRAKINFMDDIDPYSPTAPEHIKVLVGALVFDENDKNKAWERTAKAIIGGVIAHVLTSPDYEHERSLVVVYRLLNSPLEHLKELVAAMRMNFAMGDYISARANSLEMAVLEDRQSFISTVRSSLEWLSYPNVQQMVGGRSDFSMFDIVDTPMSVYLCFDIEALDNLSRFVRMFFMTAFYAMTHPRRTKTKKVLFLMDEFFTLGYLPMLEKGAQYIAGEGVKLWPIIQNIAMIESLYGKTWSNFVEAAGVIEAFGLSAGAREGTAYWVQEKLGSSRSSKLKLGEAAQSGETLPLMTQSELEQEFRREDDRSIVFIKGADPMVLRRKPYWELFHPSMYTAPAQGVPLSTMKRGLGWTHSHYFGVHSTTLSKMGKLFLPEERLRQVKHQALLGAHLPALEALPTKRRIPGPGLLVAPD